MTKKNDKDLVFLPLGGCEEIGMNVNAYGYGPSQARRWILADLGVTFGDHMSFCIVLITCEFVFLKDLAI